jgi:hypothetical protein
MEYEKFESDSLKSIVPALIKAQGEFKSIDKDSTGHNYKYANLTALHNGVKPALQANNVLLAQPIIYIEDKMFVYTILRHISGEYVKSRIEIIRPAVNDMKIVGAQITYARRYSLSAMLGVTTEEDDDCEEQSGSVREEAKEQDTKKDHSQVGVISEKQADWFKKEYDNLSTENKRAIVKDFSIKGLESIKKCDFQYIMERIYSIQGKEWKQQN